MCASNASSFPGDWPVNSALMHGGTRTEGEPVGNGVGSPRERGRGDGEVASLRASFHGRSRMRGCLPASTAGCSEVMIDLQMPADPLKPRAMFAAFVPNRRIEAQRSDTANLTGCRSYFAVELSRS